MEVPANLEVLHSSHSSKVFIMTPNRYLWTLSDLYFCDTCAEIRTKYDLQEEVEAHYCPSCLDTLSASEALSLNSRCSKCYECPRCFQTLSVVRSISTNAIHDSSNSLLIQSLNPGYLERYQRCDSFLSGSEDEEELTESKKESNDLFVYYFACGYCRWNSKPLGLFSSNSLSLPSLGAFAERHKESRRRFQSLCDVIRRSARESERARQLQARVKHKAVALLLAAAANQESPLRKRADKIWEKANGKSWRVSDTEDLLKAKREVLDNPDIWSSLRKGIPKPAPRVSFTDIFAGKHITDSRKLNFYGCSEADTVDSMNKSYFNRSFPTDKSSKKKANASFEDPLDSPQMVVDRGIPDSVPIDIPDVTLRMIVPEERLTRISFIPLNDRPSLEQRNRNMNQQVEQACFLQLLHPSRKPLLTKRSKRCTVCQRFVIKAHMSPVAVPAYRLNNCASLWLPWISVQPEDIPVEDEVLELELGVMNPLEVPIELHFMTSANGNQTYRGIRGWQTVEILTPPFSFKIDGYDEMLDELDQLDPKEDKRLPEDDQYLILKRHLNSVLVRLQVKPRIGSNQQVASFSLPVEITMIDRAGKSLNVSVTYVIALGRVGMQTFLPLRTESV